MQRNQSNDRSNRRIKSILIAVVILSLGIATVFVLHVLKPEPEKKPLKPSAPLVKVLVPKAEKIIFKVEAHGVVQPRTETTLISEVSGRVDSLSNKFAAGGLFQKGEVILQIDASDYEVSVEQSKARLASQQAKYAQEKAQAEQALKEWDLTGRSRDKAPALALRKPFLLEAKANVDSAKADLKLAQQKLARTTIRAPYACLVKSKQIDLGQYVTTGSQLGTIFSVDRSEVRLPLTDQELAFINLPDWRLGSEDKTTSDVLLSGTYMGEVRQWQGKLVRMEGEVDRESRVHYAVVSITDPYRLLNRDVSIEKSINSISNNVPLKIGTFVKASIIGKQQDNVVVLPANILKNRNQVYVSNQNNQLSLRELNVLRSDTDYVYVTPSFEETDRIVLTTIESPVLGMNLRIEGDPTNTPNQEETDKEVK